jgi:hypothetical protein
MAPSPDATAHAVPPACSGHHADWMNSPRVVHASRPRCRHAAAPPLRMRTIVGLEQIGGEPRDLSTSCTALRWGGPRAASPAGPCSFPCRTAPAAPASPGADEVRWGRGDHDGGTRPPGANMSAFSQARWGHFVGLCGLVLLAEGLSHGVEGLLKIVRSEAYLRGSDAVILLDKKAWAGITVHRVPAQMAQALMPRGRATPRRRALLPRRSPSTSGHRVNRPATASYSRASLTRSRRRRTPRRRLRAGCGLMRRTHRPGRPRRRTRPERRGVRVECVHRRP